MYALNGLFCADALLRNYSLTLIHATVPSLTSYDIPFSHNTCITDEQADTGMTINIVGQ